MTYSPFDALDPYSDEYETNDNFNSIDNTNTIKKSFDRNDPFAHLDPGPSVTQPAAVAQSQPEVETPVGQFNSVEVTPDKQGWGELGGWKNSDDGSVSTEITITVKHPELNNGMPTVIPTLVAGQNDIDGLLNFNITPQHEEIAVNRAIQRQDDGMTWPSFINMDLANEFAEERSSNKTDNAFEFSADQAQKMFGRGAQVWAELSESEPIAQWAKEYVTKQDMEIAEGGYKSSYARGSLRETFNEDGFGAALGYVGESIAENSVSSGAAIGGTAVAAIAVAWTAPAWIPLSIGALTIAGSGVLGTGESALEMEDKGVDVNNKKAAGVGIIIGLLEKVGAGKVIPVGQLAQMSGDQILKQLVSEGFIQAAKEFAKVFSKKVASEMGTEILQESAIMGAAASEGAEYDPLEVFDRLVDTAFISAGMSGPVSAASTVSDIKQANNLAQSIDSTGNSFNNDGGPNSDGSGSASGTPTPSLSDPDAIAVTGDGTVVYKEGTAPDATGTTPDLPTSEAPDIATVEVDINAQRAELDDDLAKIMADLDKPLGASVPPPFTPVPLEPPEAVAPQVEVESLESMTDGLPQLEADALTITADDMAQMDLDEGENQVQIDQEIAAFNASTAAIPTELPPVKKKLLPLSQRPENTAQTKKVDPKLVDPTKDDLLTAIAKIGGVRRGEASAEGFDPADFGMRKAGLNPVFRAKPDQGVSLDAARETLAQSGYIDSNSTVNDFVDLLQKAVRGETVVSNRNENYIAQQDAARTEDYIAQGGVVPEPQASVSSTDQTLTSALEEARNDGLPQSEIDSILTNYPKESDAVLQLQMSMGLDGIGDSSGSNQAARVGELRPERTVQQGEGDRGLAGSSTDVATGSSNNESQNVTNEMGVLLSPSATSGNTIADSEAGSRGGINNAGLSGANAGDAVPLAESAAKRVNTAKTAVSVAKAKLSSIEKELVGQKASKEESIKGFKTDGLVASYEGKKVEAIERRKTEASEKLATAEKDLALAEIRSLKPKSLRNKVSVDRTGEKRRKTITDRVLKLTVKDRKEMLRDKGLMQTGDANRHAERIVDAVEGADLMATYDTVEAFTEAVRAGQISQEDVLRYANAVKRGGEIKGLMQYESNARTIYSWATANNDLDIPLRSPASQKIYDDKVAQAEIEVEADRLVDKEKRASLNKFVRENRSDLESFWENASPAERTELLNQVSANSVMGQYTPKQIKLNINKDKLEDLPSNTTQFLVLWMPDNWANFRDSNNGVNTTTTASDPVADTATTPVSTAPEHLSNEGKKLDDTVYPTDYLGPVTELADIDVPINEIVSVEMEIDDFREITNEYAALFESPEKRVITSARVKGQDFITQEEAKQRIDSWKQNVDDQFANDRSNNSNKTIISLFDLSGEWSRPYEEAGYNVMRFDIQNGDDVMDFSSEYFNDNFNIGDVHGILIACPCTDFASSGARWFEGKDADGRTEASKELVFQALRTVEYFRPKFWVLENPVGRIERLTGLPPARMTFDPHHFGEDYTKKTMLWGKFNADLPLANVEPTAGSKMHTMFGGKSQATKNARSVTPEGFAYSFFMANNDVDATPEQRLVSEYPEASGAVKQALKAGIPEQMIVEEMEYTYGNYEYAEARQALLKLVSQQKRGVLDTTDYQDIEKDTEGRKTNTEAAAAEGRLYPSERSYASETQTEESFGLEAQTEETLAADSEQAATAATEQAAKTKTLSDRAKADAEVGGFMLTGSNAPADVAVAQGQDDMFDADSNGTGQSSPNGELRFSKSAILAPDAKPKGVTEAQIQMRVDAFLAKYKGADDVRVWIRDTQDNAFGPGSTAKDGPIKGAYYPEQDAVVFIAENIDSVQAIDSTIQHELLVHKGLGLFEAKDVQGLIDVINSNAPKSKALGKIWGEVQEKYEDKSIEVQAEELIARVAEKKMSKPDKYWNKIVTFIRDMLRKIGFVKEISFSDLRKRVYDMGAAFAEGRRAETREGFTAKTNETKSPSLDGLSGSERFDMKKGGRPDKKVKVKPGDGTADVTIYGVNADGKRVLVAKARKGGWDIVVDRRADGEMFTDGKPRKYTADNRKGVANRIESLGLTLEEKINQYPPAQREVLNEADSFFMASSTWFERRRFDFQDRFLSALKVQKAIEEFTFKQISEDMDFYNKETLKHGITTAQITEFNDVFIDPLFDLMEKNGLSMEDVGSFLYARHAPEANAEMKRRNAAFEENESLSGMSDVDAAKVMADFKAAGKMDILNGIAGTTDRVIERTRQILVETGLLSEATVQGYRDQYDVYVPLLGDPMDPDGKIKKSKDESRFGRKSRADNVLINLIVQHEQTIIRGEANVLKRVMLKLVEQNPNPDFWVIDKTTDEKVLDPVTDLFKLKETPNKRHGKHVVPVRVAGEEHLIVFEQSNDHAMMLAGSMNNINSQQVNMLTQAGLKFNRYISMINTQYNLEFMPTNLARDIQTALINVYQLDDVDNAMVARIAKNVRKSIKGIRDYQKGNRDGEMAVWYDEFYKNGAQTGWLDNYETMASRGGQLERMMKRKGSMTMDAAYRLVEFISDMNTAYENGVRLSTYIELRKAGYSIHKAAIASKNLTVNFNRRGDKALLAGSLYVFFNASMQGNTAIIQAAQSKAVRKAMMAVFGMQVALEMMNRLLGDDDDDGQSVYSKIPLYIRNNNWVFLLPDFGNDTDAAKRLYIKIPVPYGYNVINVAAQVTGAAASQLLGNRDYDGLDGGVAFTRMWGALVHGFNPVGSDASLLQGISPTFLDPLAQDASNENFAGQPIRPEQIPFGPAKPNSQLFWKSTPNHIKAISSTLNEISGGTDIRPGFADYSAETIEHYSSFLMGGAGRFFGDIVQTPAMIATGQETELRDYPWLRKFVGQVGDRSDVDNYYKAKTDLIYAQRALDAALKTEGSVSQIKAAAKLVEKEEGFKLRLIPRADEADNFIASKKLQKASYENDTELSDKVRKMLVDGVDREIRKRRTTFVSMYRAALEREDRFK